MPRLRNRLYIDGNSIRPGTIIEFQDRSGTGRQTMYMKVYNIDQTHIYYAKQPATDSESWGRLFIDTIAEFKELLEIAHDSCSMRILNA